MNEFLYAYLHLYRLEYSVPHSDPTPPKWRIHVCFDTHHCEYNIVLISTIQNACLQTTHWLNVNTFSRFLDTVIQSLTLVGHTNMHVTIPLLVIILYDQNMFFNKNKDSSTDPYQTHCSNEHDRHLLAMFGHYRCFSPRKKTEDKDPSQKRTEYLNNI